MALTHTLTFSYRDTSGNTTSYTDPVSGDAENNYDNAAVTVPASQFAIGWTQTLTDLLCMELYCSNAAVVETNCGTNETDLATDASNDEKVTSASYNFESGDVGKWVVITAGTGWTVGAYRITSVASDAAILASSPGAVSITGGHWHLSSDYIELIAGQVLMWASNIESSSCPFNFNVTGVFLTIAGSASTASFKIRAVQNI
jgi:hypothetical protein